MLFFPLNEAETIKLFKLTQEKIGWKLVHLQQAFPDAIIAKAGIELKAEFEYRARNFEIHGHDPEGCDIIICWENNWPDSPLPVCALNLMVESEATIIGEILGGLQYENSLLQGEMANLRQALRCAMKENQILRGRLGMVVYAIEEI